MSPNRRDGGEDHALTRPEEIMGNREAARREELFGHAVRVGAVASSKLRQQGSEAARGDDRHGGDHRAEKEPTAGECEPSTHRLPRSRGAGQRQETPDEHSLLGVARLEIGDEEGDLRAGEA